MPLGKEVGLGPGHIVLDGDPVGTLPPTTAEQPLPTFGPCLLWPNGRPSQQLLSSCSTCRSEMYYTRHAGNAGRKKSPKKSPSGHHRTTLSGYILATKARIDNRKNLLSMNISSTCPQNMMNFSLLAAEIVSLVWGTPANFNSFRVLASLLQRRRSTEANQTLHDVWPSFALIDYLCTFGGCCPVTEFCQAHILVVVKSHVSVHEERVLSRYEGAMIHWHAARGRPISRLFTTTAQLTPRLVIRVHRSVSRCI